MVTIRLSRLGRKKGAFYRIIAVDSTKKTVGLNLGVLGYWNPLKKDLKIDKEKYKKWVDLGAQVTTTVKKLVEPESK